jgi:2-dehydropantoate 2-reductase
MRVAVVGSGGIGAFLGGGLARSGQDVSFLARGKHLEAIRSQGLIVESVSLGNFQLKVKATDKPTDIGTVDLVLFCVKSYDTETALQQIGPLIGKSTTVLCFQNGVDNEDEIASAVGKEHVLAGAIFVESYISKPGKIVQSSGPWRIVIGEMDGTITRRAKLIHEALEKAGLKCELSNRIQEILWEKFLFICATGGICSISRASLGQVLEFQSTRELYVSSLREIAAVAKAKGIKLADDIVARTLTRADTVNKATKPSMLRDLEHGKRLEVDALNGTVSRFGRELSVPTPVNDFIYATLKLQDLNNGRGT